MEKRDRNSEMCVWRVLRSFMIPNLCIAPVALFSASVYTTDSDLPCDPACTVFCASIVALSYLFHDRL
jgi:hypothetical protein